MKTVRNVSGREFHASMPRRYEVTATTRRGFGKRWSCTIRATNPVRDAIVETGLGHSFPEALEQARYQLRWKRAARRRMGVAS